MKRNIIVVMALAASAAGMAQEYQLVWSDEFNSTESLNNWNIETRENMYFVPNNELQCYTQDNIAVEDGCLVITARREDKTVTLNEGDNNPGRTSFNFTSGRLNSCKRVEFQYGRLEARIKFPVLRKGMWPAFWMMGDQNIYGGWPANGEIDIFEAGQETGNNSERFFSEALHAPGYDTYHTYTHSSDFTGEWHVFSIEWSEGNMKFFIDGTKYAEETNTPATFNGRPYHILFNLAVGGDFPRIYDASGITALPNAGSESKMYVDWVRIYQKEGQVNVTTGDGTPTYDVQGVGPAPTPTAPASCVKSIYGEHYAAAGNGTFFETWGSPGESIYDYAISDSDKAKKVATAQWGGINFNYDYSMLDVSDMEYLHIDLYAFSNMTIKLSPVTKDQSNENNPSYEYLIQKPLSIGWNSIDIPLSDFTSGEGNMNFAQAIQLKWAEAGNNDFLIDNVYFYKEDDTPVQEEATITMPAKYATFSSDKAYAFNGDNGLNAYIVSGLRKSGSQTWVLLSQVDVVPANTGVLLKGTQGQTYTLTATDASAFYSNLLVGTVEATTVQPTENGKVNLFLKKTGEVYTFSRLKAQATSGAGKAYLSLPEGSVPASANTVGILFDDETTGVQALSLDNASPKQGIYDLQGRCVMTSQGLQPGLYIVDGKKVVLK